MSGIVSFPGITILSLIGTHINRNKLCRVSVGWRITMQIKVDTTRYLFVSTHVHSWPYCSILLLNLPIDFLLDWAAMLTVVSIFDKLVFLRSGLPVSLLFFEEIFSSLLELSTPSAERGRGANDGAELRVSTFCNLNSLVFHENCLWIVLFGFLLRSPHTYRKHKWTVHQKTKAHATKTNGPTMYRTAFS